MTELRGCGMRSISVPRLDALEHKHSCRSFRRQLVRSIWITSWYVNDTAAMKSAAFTSAGLSAELSWLPASVPLK